MSTDCITSKEAILAISLQAHKQSWPLITFNETVRFKRTPKTKMKATIRIRAEKRLYTWKYNTTIRDEKVAADEEERRSENHWSSTQLKQD